MARTLSGNGIGDGAEIVNPQAVVTLSIHSLFGHFKDAMAVGSGHATELIESLTKALAQAYVHIDTLVSKIISLSEQLGDLTAKAVAIAEVEAKRDVKIAEAHAATTRETHLFAMAESPFGRELLSMMRRLLRGRLGGDTTNPELQKAARRAVDKLLSDSGLIELMQEAAGDDWNPFVDWVKETLR